MKTKLIRRNQTSPSTIITGASDELDSESEKSMVIDRPFAAWKEVRSGGKNTPVSSPLNPKLLFPPQAYYYNTSQFSYQTMSPEMLTRMTEHQMSISISKSGRPPFLRLAVEATSEVDRIEARGQQGCWVAFVVRAEICPGDWDMETLNVMGRGLDIVLVLDISSVTPP